MAKELITEIKIKANPAQVWAVLTDFSSYPTWNPFIKSLTGDVTVGNTIMARLEPPKASGMTFKPKVLEFEANKKFVWLGHLFIKGLFDGEHSFELIDNLDGTTTFIQSEKFEGVLLPLFKKMLDVNTKEGFELMNKALQARVENL